MERTTIAITVSTIRGWLPPLLTPEQKKKYDETIGARRKEGEETAHRVMCAANLRQIGQGLILWANEHKGKLPDELGAIAGSDIEPEAFLCPSSGNTLPAGFSKQTAEQKSAWITAHSDYVYLGKGRTMAVAEDVIIAHEKGDDHASASGPDTGMNVLYGNGSVKWVAGEEVQHVLKELDAGHNPPQP